MKNNTKDYIKYVLIIIIPLATIFLSLLVGRFFVSPTNAFKAIANAFGASFSDVSSQAQTVIIYLRIPRIIAAFFVGAALSASGSAYQGVFKNPLVNSGLLGVSSGASLGAAIAIVLFGSSGSLKHISINIFAFLFGLLAVFLSYQIAKIYKTVPTIMLVLGGTIVSSIFNALFTLVKSVADTESQLPAIVYWTMGSVASCSYEDFWALIPIIAGVAVLLVFSYQINLISVGEKEAQTMGINVSLSKIIIITAASLASSGAVCLSGSVGWVGLVIPHISRMLVGSDNKKLIPVSISIGAGFMVLVDTLSRSLVSSEIPLGVLTSLIGAPFFIYLLKKTKGANWR